MTEEIITLLPRQLAKIGYKFYFIANNECTRCQYRNICVSKLRDGRLYVVTRMIKEVPKNIICPMINDIVIPVYIRLSPITVNLLSSGSLSPGMLTTFVSPSCDKFNCPFRKMCYPKGLNRGDTIRVSRLYTRIPCPLGYPLISAEVLPHVP